MCPSLALFSKIVILQSAYQVTIRAVWQPHAKHPYPGYKREGKTVALRATEAIIIIIITMVIIIIVTITITIIIVTSIIISIITITMIISPYPGYKREGKTVALRAKYYTPESK